MLRNIAILALIGLTTALPQPATDIPAIVTTPPHGSEPGAAPTRVSPDPTGPISHGPYSGSATVTGKRTTLALKFDGPAIPNPTATYYNPDGELRSPAQLPFLPGGGKGVNGTLPRYMVESDFDFESVNLGLHQEFIELDLFNNGLARFSDKDFMDAGLTAEDRAFIAFMATQEINHATLITNMLGEAALKQCTYDYPFTTVREFIDFNVKLTRWGESGNWGFISHLDSREVATLLVQAESIEARQQMAFRQMLGLHPMPVSFTPGNFPALHILNTPNPNRVSPNDTAEGEIVGPRVADPSISNLTEIESCVHNTTTGYNCSPAISRNRTEPLTFPGRKIFLEWEETGMAVGPNNSYVTSTTAGEPKFLAWISQINTTYTPLEVTGPNQGWSWQPPNEVYQRNPAVNETVFVAVTDSDLYLTSFNLTLINPHVRALGIFIAG
ncbi:hypothetical protein EJ07DRAFT_162877 [Lizonia empirigonia]|nr:hypothetical protein EJ07DRAFT_162877 [Lizonia empirigonia]